MDASDRSTGAEQDRLAGAVAVALDDQREGRRRDGRQQQVGRGQNAQHLAVAPGPNSASGTAPRMMVTRPLETPNSRVKASAVQKLAPPSISTRNDSGMKAIDTRPTSMGCQAARQRRGPRCGPPPARRPSARRGTRRGAAARPVASRIGTRCTASAPNTTALAATIRLNRRHGDGARGALRAVAAAAAAAASAAAARARPAPRFRGAPGRTNAAAGRPARLMAAKISSVVRQPTRSVERVADRPEHAGGKAAEQRQVGDGAASARRASPARERRRRHRRGSCAWRGRATPTPRDRRRGR